MESLGKNTASLASAKTVVGCSRVVVVVDSRDFDVSLVPHSFQLFW
jgi:hypothetical protein